MYNITSDKTENKRRVITYTDDKTGTEVKITPIYKDKNGQQWFAFIDLHRVPYIRLAYGKHVTDLFTMGLGLKDILKWCEEEKAILKGDDPEKYEKLYSMVLEKERIARHTADPIKMHLSLCTIYVLEEGERIDWFDESISDRKFKLWAQDRDAAAFFLSWHTDRIQDYINPLIKITKTVSKMGIGKG